MSTAVANPASEKQVNFIKTLFTEASEGTAALTAAGKDTVVASFASQVQPLEALLVAALQGQPVEKRDASDAITVLLSVTKQIKAATAPPTPLGLVAVKPLKTIPNRFAKNCRTCGVMVPEGSGYAVLSPGQSWFTYCHACAHQDPAERAAQVQAETAARQAKHAADQAQREAEWQARYEINLFGNDLFVRASVDTQALPKVRVALPSATGNNDLDFFTVKANRYGDVQVLRVIGGHADQPLDASQSLAVLERLVLTEDIPEAMATFGRELHFCGRCGRHLTDEASRAVGLGPDCAEQMGF